MAVSINTVHRSPKDAGCSEDKANGQTPPVGCPYGQLVLPQKNRYRQRISCSSEIHNFTVLDADVFAILSADFKHGIDFRHPVSCTLGLRSDLIPDNICSDAFADALSS